MSKNWDKPNDPAFAGPEGFNACYISDIEEHVARGGYVVFGLVKKRRYEAAMWFLSDLSLDIQDVRLHPLPDTPETKGCYWWDGNPDPDWGEPKYRWEMGEGSDILIWWDHDLGDVALDRIPEGEEEAEHVWDNVYFQWIT